MYIIIKIDIIMGECLISFIYFFTGTSKQASNISGEY